MANNGTDADVNVWGDPCKPNMRLSDPPHETINTSFTWEHKRPSRKWKKSRTGCSLFSDAFSWGH